MEYILTLQIGNAGTGGTTGTATEGALTGTGGTGTGVMTGTGVTGAAVLVVGAGEVAVSKKQMKRGEPGLQPGMHSGRQLLLLLQAPQSRAQIPSIYHHLQDNNESIPEIGLAQMPPGYVDCNLNALESILCHDVIGISTGFVALVHVAGWLPTGEGVLLHTGECTTQVTGTAALCTPIRTRTCRVSTLTQALLQSSS